VRNLNLVAGTLLGMDRRALGRLFGELDEFERACRKRNIPFFVLGPTPTIYSAWADRIVRNGNVSIQRRFAESDVPYALIEARYDADGKSLLRADGTHLSIEGQRFVGELLYRSGMPEWMTAILARRDAASV
jgi:lysophospholipase L1-like esterase